MKTSNSWRKKKLEIIIALIDKFDQARADRRRARAYLLGGCGQLSDRADKGGCGARVGAVAPVSDAQLPP